MPSRCGGHLLTPNILEELINLTKEPLDMGVAFLTMSDHIYSRDRELWDTIVSADSGHVLYDFLPQQKIL